MDGWVEFDLSSLASGPYRLCFAPAVSLVPSNFVVTVASFTPANALASVTPDVVTFEPTVVTLVLDQVLCGF